MNLKGRGQLQIEKNTLKEIVELLIKVSNFLES